MMLFFTTSFSPEAYYDAMSVPLRAPRSVQPLTISELHLFSYLGCLLGMLRGQPATDWGYQFSLTQEGYPFSAELSFSHEAVIRQGFHSVDEAGRITVDQSRTAAELAVLEDIRDWGGRSSLLRTATDCSLALPIGAIKHAFSQLPAVRIAGSLGQQKILLEHDEVSLLHEEFKLIDELLGNEAKDLLAPAVVWLSARVLRHEESRLAA